ncbi:MAG: hypothetical protein AAGJ79_02565, partial [Verrucomicrobiota bacterium]
MKPLPIILLVAGLAVGFLIGKGISTGPSEPSSTAREHGGSDHGSSTILRASDAMENKAKEDAKDGQDEKLVPGAFSTKRLKTLLSAFEGKPGPRRTFEIQSAIYDLSLEEIVNVWPEIEEKLDSDSEAWNWSSAFFTRWAELDRDGAMETTEELDGWRSFSAKASIAMSWAESDPNAALGWAADREKLDERNYIYNAILEGIARTDKERAFNLAVAAIEEKTIDGSGWWGVKFFDE